MDNKEKIEKAIKEKVAHISDEMNELLNDVLLMHVDPKELDQLSKQSHIKPEEK